MSKQIPELTIITTPTAGQESLIETVVARHDTYATSRMTLAQIFTLGSISGAIKVALDALTTAIGANTTAITTKLNTIGGTRTGLTANRALITDASGVETYLTGTTTQVIGFDGAGKPIAVTPTVDIHSQTLKTNPTGADEVLLSDSESSFTNKKITLSEILSPIGGNGSDGALSISSGTTTLTFDANGYIEKNYSSITITGGTLNFSGPTVNGGVAVIKCSGRFSMTGGTIDISGMGGAGGASGNGNGAVVVAGSNGFNVLKVNTSNPGSSNGNSSTGGSAGGSVGHFGGFIQGYCGGGGGGGNSTGGSNGGRGGGVLFIEIKESFNFTSGTISASGSAGVTAGGGSGGGGGGGGSIFIKCPNIIANTGTINVNGGAGGNASATNFNVYGGGGGGGGYSQGGNGGTNSATGTTGTSNAYGSGGVGGTGANGGTPTGGGGGGGAGFYKIN